MRVLIPIIFVFVGVLSSTHALPDHRQLLVNAGARPPVSTTEAPKLVAEKNKQIILDFYRELFEDKNIEAIDKYIDAGVDNYIQHNPYLADGREPLKAVARRWFQGPWRSEIQRVVAEDDLVFVHVRVLSKYLSQTLGGKAVAIVDIFRLKNGKIVEHWDAIQSVPDRAANDHPMF